MKFLHKFRQYEGFTLAEVLITLGIIGVVAALALPTFIQNYQKTQYVTALKKAYTQFNQVLLQIAVDNGTPDSIADYFASGSIEYRNVIPSKFKVVKTCGTAAGDECFAKFDDNYDGSANTTIRWTNDVNSAYKFVTADGMSFALITSGSGCTTNYGFAAAPDAPITNHVCGAVFIDINGTQKPNYHGRDVFEFYITSNKTPLLYPSGGFYHSYDNLATTTTGGNAWWNYNNTRNYCGAGNKNGSYCPGRIMEKGWEMDF